MTRVRIAILAAALATFVGLLFVGGRGHPAANAQVSRPRSIRGHPRRRLQDRSGAQHHRVLDQALRDQWVSGRSRISTA